RLTIVPRNVQEEGKRHLFWQYPFQGGFPRSTNVAEHHEYAAAPHEHAARHHTEAAKHHKARHHEQTPHHAPTARRHHEHATTMWPKRPKRIRKNRATNRDAEPRWCPRLGCSSQARLRSLGARLSGYALAQPSLTENVQLCRYVGESMR